MDKRVKRTKQALKEAFITLHAKKSIDKIKITELCSLAGINKSTFYSYYTDIFNLAESLRKEAVRFIIRDVFCDIEYTFLNPEQYTEQIMISFRKNISLITNLYTEYEMTDFGIHLEKEIKRYIFKKNPTYKNDVKINILLSYCIQGAIHAQLNNMEINTEEVFSIVKTIVQQLQPLFAT